MTQNTLKDVQSSIKNSSKVRLIQILNKKFTTQKNHYS